jgi:hypothetical protein
MAGLADRWGEAAAGFLRRSHLVPPTDLPRLVAEHAAPLGVAEAAVFLVDLEQRWLVPLLPNDAGDEPVAVSGTVAGRAYQHLQVTTAAAGDGLRLWVPLVDGAERLGVLRGTLAGTGGEQPPDEVLIVATRFASLVAEVLVARSAYGDNIVLTRRRGPLTLASENRWSLLPPLTAATDELTIAAVVAPAYTIAGDAFDYAINGPRLELALFDAVGHDLHASRVVNLALASYRWCRRACLELPDAYVAIGQHLREMYGDDEFVTSQLVTLDTRSGQLSWLCAGHPRPLLLRNGRVVRELQSPTSRPLGVGHEPKPVAHEHLEPGDHLVFFTDGFVEARSDDGALFGVEGLIDVITKAISGGLPLSETVRRAAHAVTDSGMTLGDDATLVVVHWHD